MLKEKASYAFPLLATSRLTLRQLREADVKDISLLRSNESVNRYVERAKHTTLREAYTFIHMINQGIREKQWLYWAICMKESYKLIGTICLWNFSEDNTIAEVGYELDPAFQGKGYMSEALNAVIDYSFYSLHLNTLEAITHKENNRSARLLLRHNFKHITSRKDPENENNCVFTLLAKG